MTDRLTVAEVQTALENGVNGIGSINKTIRCIEENDDVITLQNPQIRAGRGDHSITFSNGDNSIERFIGTDTERVNGEDVFKRIVVLPELPLQGGRRSRKRSRKVTRKRSRKANKKGRKSRKY